MMDEIEPVDEHDDHKGQDQEKDAEGVHPFPGPGRKFSAQEIHSDIGVIGHAIGETEEERDGPQMPFQFLEVDQTPAESVSEQHLDDDDQDQYAVDVHDNVAGAHDESGQGAGHAALLGMGVHGNYQPYSNF